MGRTTERLTRGEFSKRAVMSSVALGVAVGVALGIMRMIKRWHLGTMLVCSYSVALLLTLPCNDMYVCVAWDAAGVTTGSITVPLVLAMGLGLGKQLQVHDAFGVLSMASVGPILSVLITGLWLKRKDDIVARFPTLGRLMCVKPSGFRAIGGAEDEEDGNEQDGARGAASGGARGSPPNENPRKKSLTQLAVTGGEDSVLVSHKPTLNGGTF